MHLTRVSSFLGQPRGLMHDSLDPQHHLSVLLTIWIYPASFTISGATLGYKQPLVGWCETYDATLPAPATIFSHFAEERQPFFNLWKLRPFDGAKTCHTILGGKSCHGSTSFSDTLTFYFFVLSKIFFATDFSLFSYIIVLHYSMVKEAYTFFEHRLFVSYETKFSERGVTMELYTAITKCQLHGILALITTVRTMITSIMEFF